MSPAVIAGIKILSYLHCSYWKQKLNTKKIKLKGAAATAAIAPPPEKAPISASQPATEKHKPLPFGKIF